MKKSFAMTLIAGILIPLPTSAVEGDRCSILLQDGVRNRLSETYDKNFLEEFHSAMCSEKSERIDKAKKQGINLGFDDFVFDFAGSTKKIASYQESMCSSRDRISTGSTFYKLTRNHVSVDLVDGFNECIRITEGGMDFNVTEGKDSDSITIDVGYSRTRAPRAALEVTHLVINPQNLENQVDCKGPLAKTLEGQTIEITQPIGVQGVTCRPGPDFPREGDNDFSVVLHTTVGHIEGHVKPFHKGKSDRLTELEGKVSSLTSNINKFNLSVVGFESESCPPGWEPYKAAYGVFLRGLDLSGKKIDPDGRRKFRVLQGDQNRKHSHAHIHWTNGASMLPNMVHSKAGAVNTGQPSGNTGPSGGSESRPKNVALLFCQKVD